MDTVVVSATAQGVGPPPHDEKCLRDFCTLMPLFVSDKDIVLIGTDDALEIS